MFIGHLPAGYLVLRNWTSGAVLAAGLVGSVAPDLDMLWFYLIDDRQFHHHEYITHRPIVWMCIALIGLSRARHLYGRMALAFGLAGVLHMGLDTIAGSIAWGWPFYTATQTLVVVPPTQSHWIMSFLTHWTFAVEIVLTLISACIFVYDALDRTSRSD